MLIRLSVVLGHRHAPLVTAACLFVLRSYDALGPACRGRGATTCRNFAWFAMHIDRARLGTGAVVEGGRLGNAMRIDRLRAWLSP